MAIITSVDSVLGELSRLDGHPRLPSLLTLEIKNLQLELRFLKMLFWCFAKWDDAAKDANLGPRVTDIAAQLRKAGQGLYASGLIAIQRGQIKNWKIVASNLLENIERRKPDIEKICLVLLDCSFECNFSTSYEVLDFISTILENLKDFVSSKAIFTGPMENQIIALEEILRFLGRFVDFFATRAVMYEKLEDFWNHVQGCANKAACVSILFWVKAMAEPKSDSVLSDLLQKIKPFTPEVIEMYLGVLKASKSSRSDASLMGQVVATFVDSLLKNLPDSIMDNIPVLSSGLMFLITFLIDPPKESKLGGNLIWTKVDDIVSDAASFICSFRIEKTKVHFAEGRNKFLHELFQKIDMAKADIKKLYFQDSDSSVSDFPKTNGLGFINFLLGKIDEMLISDAEVCTFAKYQFAAIRKELVYLQGILKLRSDHDELEDIWMRIFNVAYRVEHVIDSSLIVDAPIWKQMIHLSDVIERMELIKHDVEKSEAKPVLGGEMKSGNDLSRNDEISRIDEVVGMEDETRRIMDQLTKGSNELEIVCLVGLPGIGKTTLAKKVYNSPLIQYHFDIRAWCHVSQAHNRRKSLLKIFNFFAGVDKVTSEMSDEQLAEKIYKYLKGRRFLIILDDIWDMEVWDEIRSLFPNDYNRSRILLTSRISNIAFKDNPGKHPYFLKHRYFLRRLSDEESWELLKVKLFRNDVCPPELAEVGQQIAKNCKGLPLAIVSMAGVLARKGKHLDFWKQIAQSPCSHIASEECMDILEPSYNHLPDVLKSCFLYFGTFQQENVIKVKKLVRLWIAEDFIPKTEGKSLEDVAQEYLMDLISRGLVIVNNRSFSERITECHVHDLLHNLCLTKGEEEGFLQLLNTSQLYLNGIKYKQYRLCIHSKWRPFVDSEPTGPNVHSLLFHPNNSTNEHPYAPELFNGFPLLRVLDLEALRWGVLFPEELVSLVHLRYLAVAGDFTSIPSSIDSLSYLETLCIQSYDSIIVLPNTIFNMKRLRHVDIPTGATFSWDDYDLKKFICVDNVITFSSLYVSGKENAEMLFRMLPKIRRLRFQFYNHFPAVEFLHNLESLNVHKVGRAQYSYSSNFPLTLKELTLSNLGLPWHEMSAIAKLPTLEALKLLSRSFEGVCWETEEGGFGRLEFLKLESLNITKWMASCDHLPRLQRLVVKDCVNLEEIPYTFGDIVTLKIIEVHGCSSSAALSARQIFEELVELGNVDIRVIITPKVDVEVEVEEEHSSDSLFVEGDIEQNPSSGHEETKGKGDSQRDDANIQDFGSSSMVDEIEEDLITSCKEIKGTDFDALVSHEVHDDFLSDKGDPGMRARNQQELENLSLSTKPLKTTKLFLLAVMQFPLLLAEYLLAHGGWPMLLIAIILLVGVLLVTIEDAHEKVLLEARLWGIRTALEGVPLFFIFSSAQMSGRIIDFMEKLDAKSTEDNEVNKINRWFLSLGQYVNFTVMVLALVPNPLHDLVAIMCGQFGIPFGEFFFSTWVGKTMVKDIQTLFVSLGYNYDLLDWIEAQLIWALSFIPIFGSVLPDLITKLHSTIDKFVTKLPVPSNIKVNKWELSFASMWSTIKWIMLMRFFIVIVESTAQWYHKSEEKRHTAASQMSSLFGIRNEAFHRKLQTSWFKGLTKLARNAQTELKPSQSQLEVH